MAETVGEIQDAETPAGRLRQAGIMEVVIIDDAFDPVSRDDFLAIQLESFWAEIDGLDEAREEIRAHGLTLDGPDDLTDELLEAIWQGRETLVHTRAAFEQHLLPRLQERRGAAEEIAHHLEQVLKLTVSRLGSRDEAIPGSPQFVFLDYYLARLYPIASGHARGESRPTQHFLNVGVQS